jgi:hypothetical protein
MLLCDKLNNINIEIRRKFRKYKISQNYNYKHRHNILAGLNFIFFKYKNIVDKPKNTNKIRAVLPDKTAAIINENVNNSQQSIFYKNNEGMIEAAKKSNSHIHVK